MYVCVSVCGLVCVRERACACMRGGFLTFAAKFQFKVLLTFLQLRLKMLVFIYIAEIFFLPRPI